MANGQHTNLIWLEVVSPQVVGRKRGRLQHTQATRVLSVAVVRGEVFKVINQKAKWVINQTVQIASSTINYSAKRPSMACFQSFEKQWHVYITWIVLYMSACQ